MAKVELIDWMICDDLRREDSGKLIYIGVYPANDIVVGNIPVVLPKLVFSTKWKMDKASKKYEFRVTSPDGVMVAQVSGEVPKTEVDRKVAYIQFGVVSFKIDVLGDYKVEGSVDGRDFEVGVFTVGQRKAVNS